MLMTYIIRSINIVPERICIAHALKNKVLPRQLIHYFMYIYKLYVLLNYSVHTTLFFIAFALIRATPVYKTLWKNRQNNYKICIMSCKAEVPHLCLDQGPEMTANSIKF